MAYTTFKARTDGELTMIFTLAVYDAYEIKDKLKAGGFDFDGTAWKKSAIVRMDADGRVTHILMDDWIAVEPFAFEDLEQLKATLEKYLGPYADLVAAYGPPRTNFPELVGIFGAVE